MKGKSIKLLLVVLAAIVILSWLYFRNVRIIDLFDDEEQRVLERQYFDLMVEGHEALRLSDLIHSSWSPFELIDDSEWALFEHAHSHRYLKWESVPIEDGQPRPDKLTGWIERKTLESDDIDSPTGWNIRSITDLDGNELEKWVITWDWITHETKAAVAPCVVETKYWRNGQHLYTDLISPRSSQPERVAPSGEVISRTHVDTDGMMPVVTRVSLPDESKEITRYSLIPHPKDGLGMRVELCSENGEVMRRAEVFIDLGNASSLWVFFDNKVDEARTEIRLNHKMIPVSVEHFDSEGRITVERTWRLLYEEIHWSKVLIREERDPLHGAESALAVKVRLTFGETTHPEGEDERYWYENN